MRELRKMDGINVLACYYPESVIWFGAFDGGELDVALCGHTHGGLDVALCGHTHGGLDVALCGHTHGGLDVALCGYTHGGLVRVPFLGGMSAPEQSRWPKYDLGAFPVYTDTTCVLWNEYGGGKARSIWKR